MSKGVAVLEREVEAHSSKADELSDLIDKKRSDLVAIRGCQGQAMLDGEPYDSSAAVELTSELDVLESAFSEATRRLRTAQSELREQRTAEVHKRIRNLETEQLVAIARAETAARELLETFQAAHNLTEELREAMDEVLSTLDVREEKILRCRFGLEDNDSPELGRKRTLEEVGQLFSVTRERIRQIEAKALEKIRLHDESKRLADY